MECLPSCLRMGSQTRLEEKKQEAKWNGIEREGISWDFVCKQTKFK